MPCLPIHPFNSTKKSSSTTTEHGSILVGGDSWALLTGGYMTNICGPQTMRPIQNNAKSGSTADDLASCETAVRPKHVSNQHCSSSSGQGVGYGSYFGFCCWNSCCIACSVFAFTKVLQMGKGRQFCTADEQDDNYVVLDPNEPAKKNECI